MWDKKHGEMRQSDGQLYGPDAYQEFLMSSTSSQGTSQLCWVRSRGNQQEAVVSIGLRYGVHPMVMEDVINMKVTVCNDDCYWRHCSYAMIAGAENSSED